MAICRIAAAIGVLYLVAPQVPQAVLGALPSWNSAPAPATEQAGAAALRFCSDNPETCARLLRGVVSAGDQLAKPAATPVRQADNAKKPRKPKTTTPEHEIPKLRP
jgi:hypothetical protein